ncbi:MAG: Spy/CpxP family protein refolding chaperone [Cyanobacteria bacterium]|nr:Spy/CpxP family protein refolding chaperone [Cyanobacteriota bacterium]
MSLTQEQLEKLEAIRDQYMIATASTQAEMVAIQHKISNIASRPRIDHSEVERLFEKYDELGLLIEKARHTMFLDSQEVLTPEQRKDGRMKALFMGIRGFGPMGPPPHHHHADDVVMAYGPHHMPGPMPFCIPMPPPFPGPFGMPSFGPPGHFMGPGGPPGGPQPRPPFPGPLGPGEE